MSDVRPCCKPVSACAGLREAAGARTRARRWPIMPEPAPPLAPSLTQSLTGKRVLLTGGSTGIGRAILLDLVRQGARVVTFARHPEPLHEALRLAQLPPEAGLIADASDSADLDRVFRAVDDQLGGLDVLVANAALGSEALADTQEQEWRYVVETNLLGYMACAHAALPRFASAGGGHLVMISSISAENLSPGESVYAATKAGINAFGLAARKEWAERNVRITLIEPGSVGSDMQECTPEQQRQAIAAGEMLYAEDIAAGVSWALTRAGRCDVAMLRMEPLRQKSG